jgi:hypothetical protein
MMSRIAEIGQTRTSNKLIVVNNDKLKHCQGQIKGGRRRFFCMVSNTAKTN